MDTSAVVVGAGPIGLLVTQLYARTHARGVVCIEPSRYRRDLACVLGARAALSPEEASMSASSSAGVVFECSGSPHGFAAALAHVRPGRLVVMVGLAPEPLTLEPFALVGQELRLQGSIIYSDDDFAEALSLLAAQAIEVVAMTTSVAPIEGFAEAFGLMRDPEAAMKILLHP